MCGIICEISYSDNSAVTPKVLQRNHNRGPDCTRKVTTNVGNIQITFCGAVLWMRGVQLIAQPVENEEGVLLFNGDIYNPDWNLNKSDTETLMVKLGKHKDTDKILAELKHLKGPFSIIYFSKLTKELYFTRDRIGRNSLLFYKNEESILIASVLGRNYKCVELPATHIYKLNVVSNEVTQYQWGSETEDVYNIEDWFKSIESQQCLPDEEFVFEFDETENLDDDFEVARFIEATALEYKSKITLMRKLLDYAVIQETVSKITELLEKSVAIRLEAQPQRCKRCLPESVQSKHCTVGVLFSGGLDCTILAFLADKYLHTDQSIDLLNVAFKKGSFSYDVPDRLTGKQSFEELKKLCPTRKWVFREINIPQEELEEYQASTIADLVHPRQTILDESLGSALWFAARGRDEACVSSCRVLLVGSGADELFGGYTRHRNAFKRRGWSGLERELQLDWKRISFRNLARDNRVMCDHGRQPRMPYLDEDLTDYVLKLKPWLKCFPSEALGQGIGDKLILRLVALRLGLTDVVTFPKRALQFGSRIANKKERGGDVSRRFIIENGVND